MKFRIYKQVVVSVGAIFAVLLLYLIVGRLMLIHAPEVVYVPENLPERILGDVFRPGIALPYQYNDRKQKIEGLQGDWELFLVSSDNTAGSLHISGQRFVFGECSGRFSSLSFSEGKIRYDSGDDSELGNGRTFAEVDGYESPIGFMTWTSEQEQDYLALRAPGDNCSSLFRRVQTKSKANKSDMATPRKPSD